MATNKILLKDKTGKILLPFTRSQLVEVQGAIKGWSSNIKTVDDALSYVKTWQEAQDTNLGDFVSLMTEWIGKDDVVSYTSKLVVTGDSVDGLYTWDAANSSYVAASGEAVSGKEYFERSATDATGIYDVIDDKIAEAMKQIQTADEDVDSISYNGTALSGAVTLAAAGGTSISVDEDNKTVTISSAESALSKDVIIAGGPLANDVAESTDVWPSTWKDAAGNKIIPEGATLQQIIENLFLQTKWGKLSGPDYTWTAKLNNAPNANITYNGTSVVSQSVPVGTSVKVSFSTNGGTTNSATAKVSGASYGYSLDGSNIASTATSYTQTATGGSISGTLAISSATFQGSVVSSQDTEYIVKSGSNDLIVEQNGLSATAPTFAGAKVYNVSNTKSVDAESFVEISESGFEASTAFTSKGNPYTLPTTKVTKTVTGYYPAFYGWIAETSATINDTYITEHFVDTLKAKLTQGSSADAPTSTDMSAGVATFIVAVKGSTYTTISAVDSKGMSAGTSHYVDVVVPNAADSPTYRVFYITNLGVSGTTNTFTVSFSK